MNRAAMAGSCMKVGSHGQTDHPSSPPLENGGADDDLAKDSRFSDDAREKWKWIELLDEPVEAVARRRMLTVVEGSGSRR